ncbi:MAG: hypothetical protein MI757_08770, partial [Pirellulales bacterium]|nr:hypothetical protein [Pirellulales bacterium]
MIIVSESAAALKGFIAKMSLNDLAQAFVLRIALSFIMHRGRMSCSQAAGCIASETFHRGQLTRFLARPRWQREDFNAPLRQALLQLESDKGRFLFIVDATLSSQSGKKKTIRKRCHSFTFGLLITPSGYRIPWQIPHYTKEYWAQKGLKHRTTAEAAADLIRNLPLAYRQECEGRELKYL